MTWVEAAQELSGTNRTAHMAVDCPWWNQAMKQLAAISRLPAGWDSEGSDPPDAGLVDAASGLLRLLCAAGDIPRPHINPTPGGGVQLEWEGADCYFEIEVIDEVTAAWFFQDKPARMEAEGELAASEPLDDLLTYIRRAAGADDLFRPYQSPA